MSAFVGAVLLICCAFAAVVTAADREEFNTVIVDVSWTISGDGRATGYGHGNFETSERGTWNGFTFTADCSSRFPPSDNRQDTVTAYWKKWPTRMVILLQEIGGSKVSKCELKTTIRDDSKLYTRPRF